jgi:hypothetical protein
MAPSQEEQEVAAAIAMAEAKAKAALWSLIAAISSISAIVPITLNLQTTNYPNSEG